MGRRRGPACPEGGHPHGKPSSWVVVAFVVAAFAVGGLSMITHTWWTCAGIVVLSVPAGKAVGIMNDTISWGSTPAAVKPSQARAESKPEPEYDPARQRR